MLDNYFIQNVLGFQDAEIRSIEKEENKTKIYIRLIRKEHICPCCGAKTDKIHDYRKQELKAVPIYGAEHTFILEKRRYVCKCGKRFYEKNGFLPRYHRMTIALIMNVLELLKSTISFTEVAKRTQLSVTTVIRIFDKIGISDYEMPEVLSIDEFKGNTGGEKYNCILTDPQTKRVLDILPERKYAYLSEYFRKRKDRNNVNVFISDMWSPYADTASVYFKSAMQVVDKYHWKRQVFWAFERVRKDIQKKFQKDYRIYFKHSRQLLLKPYNKLKQHEKDQVSVMLSVSPTLYSAHFLKEKFLQIGLCKNRDSAKKMMADWIDNAIDSNIPAFIKCGKTMRNWFTGILNSFDTPYTNGYTEGCNNKIKVLKRNAFGYQNFKRFRKRILYMFS